jgi:hypothetical protein
VLRDGSKQTGRKRGEHLLHAIETGLHLVLGFDQRRRQRAPATGNYRGRISRRVR